MLCFTLSFHRPRSDVKKSVAAMAHSEYDDEYWYADEYDDNDYYWYGEDDAYDDYYLYQEAKENLKRAQEQFRMARYLTHRRRKYRYG